MIDLISLKEHQVLLIRNPWGENGYNQDWSHDDPNWTDELIAQVPHGFDPRSDPNETGLFVAPIELIKRGRCFDAYSIGHLREDEGYVEVWYDQLAAHDQVPYFYKFRPPTQDGDIYFTAETYSYNIIPEQCSTDVVDGYYGTSPFVYFEVTHGNNNPMSNRWDYFHDPVMIAEDEYAADELFDLMVKYEWYNSPGNDFTVKVYSKHNGTDLVDGKDRTNMLYTDGREPSEFKVNHLADD